MLLVCVNTYNVKRNVSKIDLWVWHGSLVAEVLMRLACAVFPQGCWFVSWCSQKSTRVFVWMLTAGLFILSKNKTRVLPFSGLKDKQVVLYIHTMECITQQ